MNINYGRNPRNGNEYTEEDFNFDYLLELNEKLEPKTDEEIRLF